MRLRHIDIFHAVMITGSVSSAARLLNMTQPTATRLLQNAEDQLGFPLFERIKQRLIPTEKARVLFLEAQAAYQHIERFERLARRMKHNAGEHVSILATTALAQHILPGIVAAFQKVLPDVRLEIGTGHSNTISQDIAEHRADIGLVFSPTVIPDSLEAIPLSESPLCYAYPATWGTISPLPEGLFSYPLIGIQNEDPLAQSVNTWLEHHLDTEPFLLADSRPLVLKMIEKGSGWSILDKTNIDYFLDGRTTICWEPMPDLPPIQIILLVAKLRCKNHALDTFIKHCINVCSIETR